MPAVKIRWDVVRWDSASEMLRYTGVTFVSGTYCRLVLLSWTWQ
jgi:hypothetical protein